MHDADNSNLSPQLRVCFCSVCCVCKVCSCDGMLLPFSLNSSISSSNFNSTDLIPVNGSNLNPKDEVGFGDYSNYSAPNIYKYISPF